MVQRKFNTEVARANRYREMHVYFGILIFQNPKVILVQILELMETITFVETQMENKIQSGVTQEILIILRKKSATQLVMLSQNTAKKMMKL